MRKLALILPFIFIGFALSACSDKFYEMKKSPCACFDDEKATPYNQKSEFNS